MSIKSLINRFKKKGTQLSYVATQLNNFRFNIRRSYLEDKILHSSESGITDKKYCAHEVIVSLTTYGKRMQDVCFTIESIMQQTMLPNKIVLNVDPASRENALPIALQKQIKRGLTIVVAEEDIRSYKKLIPTLKANPEAIIITIDDDVLYEFDIIERLFNSYIKNPKKVSALRTHSILLDENGLPLKYMDWNWESGEAYSSYHLFATGVGGVLYPPHCLSEEVFNQNVFTKICPTADDVWFHAMALLNGTGIVKAQSRDPQGQDYINNEDVQELGLCSINTGASGKNDMQIKAVYEKYGIYDILKHK